MIRRIGFGLLLASTFMWTFVACSGGTEPGSEASTSESAVEGTSTIDSGTNNGPELGLEAGPEPGPEPVPMPTQKEFGEGSRKVAIQLPPGYDPAEPLPLLVVLHGYGANGAVQTAYLGFTQLIEKEKFLMLAPNGTTDPANRNFWNATDACCNFANSSVDDVAYIKGLIEEVKSVYRVNEKKIFLVGHSNGGFMSYRMACDSSASITGIAVLAGAMFNDKSRCKPSRKINILHIHGTDDSTILYKGGTIPAANKKYPGAEQSVGMWKTYNECSGDRKDSGTKIDLENKLAGDETTVTVVEGCPSQGAVELWTIQKGGHLPVPSPSFAQQVWDWLNQKADATP